MTKLTTWSVTVEKSEKKKQTKQQQKKNKP
jgi:hypothetical protein